MQNEQTDVGAAVPLRLIHRFILSLYAAPDFTFFFYGGFKMSFSQMLLQLITKIFYHHDLFVLGFVYVTFNSHICIH